RDGSRRPPPQTPEMCSTPVVPCPIFRCDFQLTAGTPFVYCRCFFRSRVHPMEKAIRRWLETGRFGQLHRPAQGRPHEAEAVMQKKKKSTYEKDDMESAPDDDEFEDYGDDDADEEDEAFDDEDLEDDEEFDDEDADFDE